MDPCVYPTLNLAYHATFFPESNSVLEHLTVSRLDNEPIGVTILHSLTRELLWEDGKALTMSFDWNKALSRFASYASYWVDPF